MTLLDAVLDHQLYNTGELGVVTSVLGATANWYGHLLLSRILSAGNSVIHISFAHGADYHRDCLQKFGINLEHYVCVDKYAFIDGLSELFYAHLDSLRESHSIEAGSRLRALSTTIRARFGRAMSMEGNKYLIVEGLDLLMSAGGLSSHDLVSELLDWHTLAFSTIVFVNADLSFVSRIRARLEIEEASFLTTLAHQASCLSTLRMLDTGLAKGISGVLRVTSSRDRSSAKICTGYNCNEREVLYYVRDGSVEIFDRGHLGN